MRHVLSPDFPVTELLNFTNREKEREVLRRLLDLPSGQPLPVGMFHGVGGTGSMPDNRD